MISQILIIICILIILGLILYILIQQKIQNANTAMIAEISALLQSKDNKYADLTEKDEKIEKERNTNLIQKITTQVSEQLNIKNKEVKDDVAKTVKERIDSVEKNIQEHIKIIESLKIKQEQHMNDNRKAMESTLANIHLQTKNLTDSVATITGGNIKKTGVFGEKILETILQHAGFSEQTYEKEFVIREGKRVDFLLYLPNNTKLIIECKSPTEIYKKRMAIDANTHPEEYKKSIMEMLKTVKVFIDTTHEKYFQIDKNVLDTMILFVPIEQIIIDLKNTNILEYAYSKNIVIATPSTILLALSVIMQMWKSHNMNERAEAILEASNAICKKVDGILESSNKIGRNIDLLQKAKQEIDTKLTGRGGIEGYARKIDAIQSSTTSNAITTAEHA